MTAPRLLSARVRAAILDRRNEVILSAASGWEIAVKHKLGRLELPAAPKSFIAEAVSAHAVSVLPVTLAHGLHAGGLKFHHKDPFDRLLIAQSELDGLPVATPDAIFRRYRIETVW